MENEPIENIKINDIIKKNTDNTILNNNTNNNEINKQKSTLENNIKITQNNEATKKDYMSEVKKYLNSEGLNKEYYDLIENNPDKIFTGINERLFSIWQSIIHIFEPTIIESDTEIIAHIPDRKDQKVIINDAKRTRVRESKLYAGFQKILEMVLTFYCDTKKINYKQGLNEIFGALILMKYKIKELKLLNIFNFGEAFIDNFLPNYYYEPGIYSLKISQSLFVLLLKYHEPSVFNYLDSFDIPHEMYAANWLLTMRSSKLNLNVLYYFWDILIKINDPLYIHFILVAFIIYHRELLMNCDTNLLIKLMTGLTINSTQEVNGINKIALELRKNTPYSFRILANKLGFLKTNNQDIENIYEKYKPEQILTLPIYPNEILYENNKDEVICPDPECKNNKSDKKKNEESQKAKNKNHRCEKCDMHLTKDSSYVILDLRIFPPSYFKNEDDYFKMGFVSGMMALDKEELESNDIDKVLASHLLQIRGKNHIILMTSKTDYFDEFEQKFYSDMTSENERKKMLAGIIETEKVEKKLSLSDAKNLNLEEIYKLKEYDNYRKIINAMKNKNYPYVSYLEGGFEALHKECSNYNIELIGHDKSKCKLCQEKKSEKKNSLISKIFNRKNNASKVSNILWKNEKKITKEYLDMFFLNENNIVIFCSLHKYKNKTYHNKDYEILVAILFEKKTIEIYKKEVRNENYIYEPKKPNDKKNSNYYNLGIKKDKNENDFELKLIEEIQYKDLLSVGYNHEFKKFIHIEVKNKDKSKNENSFIIELEFLSIFDSKNFMTTIKKLDNY